eukprot:TRINITY_DN10743_c0_g1_i4.p1 TRINITY_DN10743_c0_g1~~TRINITY_DN10743_c0_g1_i4.p1  ORF type:complete len:442 (+),score=70.46 TRINITY_DN10743_c0_g1_i4:167-1492(+)
MDALLTLRDHQNVNPATVPYVFMLTDGAVHGEDTIVNDAKKFIENEWPHPQKPRFMTCGIGQYTNAYFLKMLASFGRGFCELVLEPHRLYEQIHSLMDRASVPVLTNVQLVLPPELQSTEIYPGMNYMHPHTPWAVAIPDLFVGAPLVITGKFIGYANQPFTLVGTLPDGSQHSMQIAWRDQPGVPSTVQPIPVAKMMAKQRIDMLTSESWLCQNEDPQRSDLLKQMAVDESTTFSIVSPYTVMVAVETTPQKYQDYQETKKKKGSSGSSKAFVAIAVGGAVVLGAGAAALVMFGNPGMASGAASGLNVVGGGIVDGFSFLGEGLFEGGSFLVGGLAEGAGFIGEGIVAGAEGIAEGGEAVVGCCGGCCDDCGFCGDCLNNIGDCFSGCWENLGDCCGNIGDCCGDINCGDCCDNIGECCENIPCGEICECIGSLLGGLAG